MISEKEWTFGLGINEQSYSVQYHWNKDDYNVLAVSDGLPFGTNKATIYRHKFSNAYLVTLNDQPIGEFTRIQLQAIQHVLKDGLDLTKGS